MGDISTQPNILKFNSEFFGNFILILHFVATCLNSFPATLRNLL